MMMILTPFHTYYHRCIHIKTKHSQTSPPDDPRGTTWHSHDLSLHLTWQLTGTRPFQGPHTSVEQSSSRSHQSSQPWLFWDQSLPSSKTLMYQQEVGRQRLDGLNQGLQGSWTGLELSSKVTNTESTFFPLSLFLPLSNKVTHFLFTSSLSVLWLDRSVCILNSGCKGRLETAKERY